MRLSRKELNEQDPLYAPDLATRILISVLTSNGKYVQRAQKIAANIPPEGKIEFKIERRDFGQRLLNSLDKFDYEEVIALKEKIVLALFDENPVWKKRVKVGFVE